MDTIVEWARALWGLWLMLIFLGIVAWALWPGRKRKMEEHARIPLDDPADELDRADALENKRDGRQD